MKKRLLAMSLLFLASSSAAQEKEPCWSCTIGIFDDNTLNTNFGFWNTPGKTFYLAIRYDPASVYDGLTGIEFSIEGLPATFLPPTFTILNGGIKFGDEIHTPPDTTAEGATGGWNVVWQECQPGSQVLVEMNFVSFDAIPNDMVFRVHRKFPPNDTSVAAALFTTCEFPNFPKVRVTGGCYVVNPTVRMGESVGNPPCTLCCEDAVEQDTWSKVKQLYRD